MSFEIDGNAWEVGISVGPQLTISGYEIADAAWATAGQPVRLRVKFWNKGASTAPASVIRWESPNAGVKFASTESRLPALKAGESNTLPITFMAEDAERAAVRIVGVAGTTRMPLEVPIFPAAEPAASFEIADGRTMKLYRHASVLTEESLGEGNGDGHAAPGESFAVLVPDTNGARTAELFTNDACVENRERASDSWDAYDHAGASIPYSIAAIRPECEPGHVVHMLARVVIPGVADHIVRYWKLEFPVWYRAPGK